VAVLAHAVGLHTSVTLHRGELLECGAELAGLPSHERHGEAAGRGDAVHLAANARGGETVEAALLAFEPAACDGGVKPLSLSLLLHNPLFHT